MKIDLKDAYSEFTQESLFQTVCEENIGDASDYTKEQVAAAKEAFGTWKDVASLSRDLLKMYQDHWSSVVDAISSKLSFYVAVDYSSMLQDDIFTGYIDLLKCDDGSIVLNMVPEGIKNSNLSKQI